MLAETRGTARVFRPATIPRVPGALIALTVLAGALRLPTLGSQSLWLDETLTGRLARGDLGELIHRVADEEANPPLFYLLEWVWTRVAGTSEVALRLPSAAFGILLVPVAWAIGRRLGGERAAVTLGALVAVHPLLVYYSQEARGYAAVALACGAGFLWFLDALEGRRSAWWWALASAVALGCHYFAVFPVAIEAAILLARRGRAALPALAGVAAAGVGLLPLVLEQLGGDHGENVTAGTSLAERVKGAATSWLVGERGATIDNWEWLVGALLLAGVAVGARQRLRAAGGLRPEVTGSGPLVLPTLVGGGAVVLMIAVAAGGADYLNNRNTLPALAIAVAVPALGFAAGRAAAILGAAACAALLVATLGALTDPAHEREDWRGLSRALDRDAAVVVAPAYDETPLRWYRPALTPAPPEGVSVARIAVVLTDPERHPVPPDVLREPPAPGFAPGEVRRRQRMLIAYFNAPALRPVKPGDVDTWAHAVLDPARGRGEAALLAEEP
jgi:mannosyltransferase